MEPIKAWHIQTQWLHNNKNEIRLNMELDQHKFQQAQQGFLFDKSIYVPFFWLRRYNMSTNVLSVLRRWKEYFEALKNEENQKKKSPAGGQLMNQEAQRISKERDKADDTKIWEKLIG